MEILIRVLPDGNLQIQAKNCPDVEVALLETLKALAVQRKQSAAPAVQIPHAQVAKQLLAGVNAG